MSSKPLVEQRTTVGPVADDIWAYRMLTNTGREPTFDERRLWESELDRAAGNYLVEHPEADSSPQRSSFRFLRQPAVGMSKEQVLILLGPPDATTTEEAQMEKLARQYWSGIKVSKPTELWSYPMGWFFYFADTRLIDITQYQPR